MDRVNSGVSTELMRVVQIDLEFGLDHLVMVDRDRPQKPAAGDVVIRMLASSLNARDLLTANGVYNPRQPLPLIPCSDGVGEVVGVGPRIRGRAREMWNGRPVDVRVH